MSDRMLIAQLDYFRRQSELCLALAKQATDPASAERLRAEALSYRMAMAEVEAALQTGTEGEAGPQ
jgi:hypothetical protein